ncbi:MAG: 4Fe-4S binding protein [Pseudomonadota bacterium]
MVQIHIDEDKCNCCGLCVDVCPNEILIKKKYGCAPLITEGECFECENCIVVCETGALTVIEDNSKFSIDTEQKY